MFLDSDKESILLETGLRSALCQLNCVDKGAIKSAIINYHSLITIKPELDQFVGGGLKILGIHEAIKQYPHLMTPFFTMKENGKKINKGKCIGMC